MLTTIQIRTIVLDELHDVLDEDMSEIGELTGQEELADLALNSLSFARLIVRLEVAVGADPFEQPTLAVSDVRTVDALVAAYVSAGTTDLPAVP